MKLSIITINWNNADGLRKTIQSVVSQTSSEFEYVIVDGASTDGSVEVIKEYASDSRIKWISEPDKGIYNAMNKGLKMASGEYFQILNSADLLYDGQVVERMLNEVDRLGNPGIIYGNMIKQWPDGRRLKDTGRGEYADSATSEVKWTLYDFFKGTVNHDPTYIRSDLFERYGYYDEALKICSDWKWFVTAVVFGGEKVYYVPVDMTIFDMTGISETNLQFREEERLSELKKMFPEAVLRDYETWYQPISQFKRLKRRHMWWGAAFVERVLFKMEKWGILR